MRPGRPTDRDLPIDMPDFSGQMGICGASYFGRFNQIFGRDLFRFL